MGITWEALPGLLLLAGRHYMSVPTDIPRRVGKKKSPVTHFSVFAIFLDKIILIAVLEENQSHYRPGWW
jgi:hypothetical protein